ncbi:nitrogen assimilation transcription factor nirA [Fusarium napiforme]|uniref:Nitrogen assimilation transcription factor nirA n=1 Tax=Fusarium napiforme TaxID=42672 RepID=A0A8H5JR35_9HYPO|nr:nitrogen assimilation transcription factor nirA [Fusarium napiforme]
MLDDDASTTQDPIIYQAPYHAGVMVDPSLDQIKAANWTSIIKTNNSLRKLLQTYFLTEYTFFPAFQKDYFLQDMASGRKEYCSSLLVHAVLASACVARIIGLDSGIQKLWATGVLQKRAVYGSSRLDIPSLRLFKLQFVHSFHVFKAPLLLMPPSVPLPDQDECYGDFVLRFPAAKGPVSVNYANTFRTLSEFRLIMNDVAAVFFSELKNTPDSTVDRIKGFCIRLDSWFQNLPPDLKTREISFPWQLKLHMHYYQLSIFLLETLRMTSTSALADESVQKVLSDAKIRVETLLRLYYLRHGFESYDIFAISLLAFIGFMQAKTLDSAEAASLESRRSTVVLVAKGLQDQSQNCYLARLVLRILKSSVGNENQFLLKELDNEEEDEEAERVMEEQVKSSWPIDLEWIDVDPEKKRLENLIKRTKELEI